MKCKQRLNVSLVVASFYLKLVGFWSHDNRIEACLRRFALYYTICLSSIGMSINVMDMCNTWGNYDEAIYSVCNVVTVGIVLLKLFISTLHRDEFHGLVVYAKRNFWHSNYDPIEREIINNCYRTCTYFICIFSFFAQGTVAGFIIRPIFVNIGKNETDRMLPLKVWLNLPLYTTPYFEIMFVLQVISLFHIGVSYLCFDNFLRIVNLHAASQFRMLQYRFTEVYPTNDKGEYHDADKCYTLFKNYIKQHKALIVYCNKIEEVFSAMGLAQVLLFSLLICLDGYLILMDEASSTIRITFVFHLTGCMCQLLMFTYSCDCMMRESLNIENAAYSSPWPILPLEKNGKMIRNDLLLVMVRSRTPCCLTGCGFFVVSLETYIKVVSTAVSYFTLLRQRQDALSS